MAESGGLNLDSSEADIREADLAKALARFEYFDRYLAHWRDLEVLDVGCGQGTVSTFLAGRGCHVFGVDSDPQNVKLAAERAIREGRAIDYRVGTTEQLPYDDHQFDVVICLDVIEHTTDVSRVIGEMSRVLQPGGYLFFDSMNRTWASRVFSVWLMEALLRRRHPRGARDWRKFIKPTELRAHLLHHGFLDISMTGLTARGRAKGKPVRLEVSDDMRMAYLGIGRTPPGPPAV